MKLARKLRSLPAAPQCAYDSPFASRQTHRGLRAGAPIRPATFRSILAVTLLTATAREVAQATEWRNPTIGNWFIESNWDFGVPDSGSIARINNGGAPIIDSDGAAALFLDIGTPSGSGSAFVIGNGRLTIGAWLDVGNSTFEVNSGARVAVLDNPNYGGRTSIFGTGLVRVTGPGSYLSSQRVSMGVSMMNGLLRVENGGRVDSTSADGTAIVTGANSIWAISSGLDVYTATVSSGGTLSAGYAALYSNSTVSVIGAGSAFNTTSGSQSLLVGPDAGYAATVSVQSGGRATSTNAILGDGDTDSGGSGTVSVAGSGSSWTNSGTLYLGGSTSGASSRGQGTVNVSGGGLLTTDACIAGYSGPSAGNATVTGAGSRWHNNGDVVVGAAGTGTVEIRAGGVVSSLRGHVGFHPGATGTVIVSDPGSRWLATGSHFIGNAGTGTLEVRNGGFASTAGHSYLGFTALSSMGTALVSGAGSSWSTALNLFVGGNGAGPGGTGVLHIENGGVVNAAAATVHNTGFLRLGASPTLNGPLTFFGGFIQTSASNTFSNSFLLGAGGVLVQTTGYELTLSGDISGSGGLTKFFLGGAGTLMLTGTNTYTGATTVDGGRLMVNGSITSATMVNSGGTLGGTGTVGSATINSGGIMAPGNSVGKLTLNGDYNQTSAGALAIELGGPTPGTEFDQVSVSGHATIDGTLNVSLVNGFLPNVGDTFAIITSNSETGNFSTITSSGFTVRSDASDAGIILTVTGVDAVGLDPVEVRSISITPASNDVVITYEATVGKTYRLERNLELSDTTWDAIPDVSDQTPTADGPLEITDPGGANQTRAFYRVRLLP